MILEVTQEHIDTANDCRAKYGDHTTMHARATWCPIAQALRSLGYINVKALFAHAYVYRPLVVPREVLQLEYSSRLRQAIDNYDGTGTMVPGRFRIKEVVN